MCEVEGMVLSQTWHSAPEKFMIQVGVIDMEPMPLVLVPQTQGPPLILALSWQAIS